MADNVSAKDASNATIDFASDDISGVHYPKSKISFGKSDQAIDVDFLNRFPVEASFLPGMADSFGSIRFAPQNPQIDIQWYRDVPSALATITTANGGTAAQSIGGALFSSGTNTNGAVRAESFTRLRYHGGAEIYDIFTAAFTNSATGATAFIGPFTQSAGVPQNGPYIGYSGTTFYVGVANNGTPSNVAKASWDDPLTGTVGSKFTRNGTPEAINLANVNVYRIRYGWVGGAQIYFEVLSPDGGWVTFHTVRFPNTAATLSFRDGDMPLTLDITKTGAGATDISIFCGCWVGGNTIQPMDHSVVGQGSQTALNRNICLDVAGTGPLDCFQYKSIALQIVPASGTVTAGAITFEASNDNLNWSAVPLQDAAVVNDVHLTTYSLVASTPRYFIGPLWYRYFRARISTGVTGTTTGIQCFTQLRTTSHNWMNTHVVQATAADLNATVVGTGTFAVQDSQVLTDNGGFTDGTSKVYPAGFIFDETAGTALTENDAGAARMDSKRSQVFVIEDESTRGQRATVNSSKGLAVTLTPHTAGGWTPYHLVSAGTTNATVVKASAGVLGGWYIFNNASSMRKVAFHNTASTPTAGSSVAWTIPIPAGSAANVEFANGITFTTGIAFTTVTDLADSGATAVSANDLHINLMYK